MTLKPNLCVQTDMNEDWDNSRVRPLSLSRTHTLSLSFSISLSLPPSPAVSDALTDRSQRTENPVFKAHRLWYHSTLGLRVRKKQKDKPLLPCPDM